KSEFGRASWTRKRQQTAKKLTARCPYWLKLSADKLQFEPIPERIRIVQMIFNFIAVEGVGKVVKFLNMAKVAPFGRGKAWAHSALLKLVRNRAVLGEYQPHQLHFEGFRKTRRPIGPPSQNYFPAIVDESTFYKAQNALESRRLQRGRVGNGIANIFTG